MFLNCLGITPPIPISHIHILYYNIIYHIPVEYWY